MNITQSKRVTGAGALPVDILLALAAVYLIWGSTYLAIRLALVSFPSFMLSGGRFLTAGLILFVILKLRGVATPTWRQWSHAAIVGVLMLGGGMGGTAFAEQWVASSVAAIAAATTPIWLSLLVTISGESPTRREWIGIGIGFIGVIMLSLDGNLRASPIGAITLLIAMWSWSSGSFLSRRLQLPAGPMGFAAEMLTGGTFLLILSRLRGEHLSGPPTAQAVWAWLYLVCFGSLIAFNAYMYLLSRVRPVLATSYAFVNPVIALFLGVALAGEHVTGFAYVAVIFISTGIAFIMLKRQAKSTATTEKN